MKPAMFGPATLGALLLLGAAAHPAACQGRGGPPGPPAGRALEIGPRAGIDYKTESFILGAHLRLPVDPWRRVDVMPSLELTFQSGLTERQYNLDGAVFLDAERVLYVGGGAAFRNTFYLDDEGQVLDERETRRGYSLFGGIHSAGFGPVTTQIELRWTFIDDFEPRAIVAGVSYPIPLG